MVISATFGVANDDEIIDHKTLTSDMGKFMTWLIKTFGNNKESEKKATRLKAAWKNKRDKLARGEMHVVNHRHPHWLEVVKGSAGNEYRLLPLRVRLVREMFALSKKGHGKGSIAKLFNQRMLTDVNYSTWPMKTKQAKLWTPTYVGRVLNNIAVLGLWQPHSGARHESRKPIGKPVILYPPCISQAEFDRINDKRHAYQMKHQGKGRRLSNLLGVIARCALCRGQMTPLGSARTRLNKDGSKSQHYFLYCSNAKVAKSCTNARGWVYRQRCLRGHRGQRWDQALPMRREDRQVIRRDCVDLVPSSQVGIMPTHITTASTHEAVPRVLTALGDQGSEPVDVARCAEHYCHPSEIMVLKVAKECEGLALLFPDVDLSAAEASGGSAKIPPAPADAAGVELIE